MRRILALGLLVLRPAWPGDPSQDLSTLTLEQLMDIRVESAALHPQTLEDAPASVTIITAEDILKYGYRTLGEAVSSVRGFYASNNRTYRSIGVRGFNLPGDYGSRFLVMVNGHNMADNIFDSMLWFGVDFPIDMSLVKRIEIVRGPSSALYGTNGIFATINVITKRPGDAGSPTLIADFGSFGEKKGQAMADLPVGKDAKLLVSGSIFNNTGESPLSLPTFNQKAIDMDGEKGYHSFSNLVWGNWSITSALSDRNKTQPISWGDTVFNDPGTHLVENANFVEGTYTRQIRGGSLRWRTSYNVDRLSGRFDYPLGSGVEDNRTASNSDWIESHLTYQFDVARLGTLTAGVEAKFDLSSFQGSKDVQPVPLEFVNINRRDRSFAVLGQVERRLSRRWTLNLGGRFDTSAYRSNFASPRAALIFQPSSNWTYKFLYGRAFRNPSAYDLFYDDGLVGTANPHARPEKADTVEVDVERKVGKRMNLIAAAYGYRLRDFLEGIYNSDGLIQTQNVGKLHAEGLELEFNGRPTGWLETTVSYAFQKSKDDIAKAPLVNAPDHLAKFRLAVPIGRKLTASTGMQYYSSRLTLAESAVRPVYLADFTITSRHLFPLLDVQFGIRNAFNRTYFDPIALNPRVDSMPQPGRSIFVELVTRAPQ